MKTVFKISCLSFLLILCSSKASAQIEQGSFLIDPYIGVPGEKLISKYNFEGDGYTITGWPISIGLRSEYMFTDYIGLGFDVNYSDYGYEFLQEDAIYNNVTQMFEDALEEFHRTTLRIMARLNYHLIRTDQLDAYVGVGIGQKTMKTKTFLNGLPTSTTDPYLPFACRIATGGHFYFTENIGIHGEVGLWGGGFIQGGLSIRL